MMIGHLSTAVSQAQNTSQAQSNQQPKPEIAELATQPASQRPSSAEASKVVQGVADADNRRGADLQPELNQEPKKQTTRGINQDALDILKNLEETTSSKDEFREELTTQLEAAGLDSTSPIVDIRV